MKKLFFVRHGQSVMNTKGLYAGHTDTPLTDEGKSQAKRAGIGAKDFGIDLIISSPLSRAHDTAKIIANEIGYPEEQIFLLENLKERTYGDLEGTTYDHESAMFINQIGVKVDVHGIEQIDDLLERASTVLSHVNDNHATSKHILLVGHGNIGRAIRYHAVPKADFAAKIPNAEIVQWI